jgi:hypothetical protein
MHFIIVEAPRLTEGKESVLKFIASLVVSVEACLQFPSNLEPIVCCLCVANTKKKSSSVIFHLQSHRSLKHFINIILVVAKTSKAQH